MADEVGLVVKVPKDFDIKLRTYLLELERMGIKKTRAEMVIKLAIIGFNTEVRDV